jgi:predicted phosphodiesterase
MKLFAISDLHVSFPENKSAIRSMRERPEDWLIVAGDVAEKERDLCDTLEVLRARYSKVIWVPGNHELWSTDAGMARGEAKYRSLVARCRDLGVTTPEDPYPVWTGEGGPHLIVPMFLLYDYSFADDGVTPADALRQAEEAGIVCADEALLHPDPFRSRQEWCAQRCALTEKRLEAAVTSHAMPLVLVNHFPLSREFARLLSLPQFTIWCGTRRTEGWASRFGASVVVSGHLHIRSTRVVGGTRFEEVSLGYPRRHWDARRGVDSYVRQILPHPASPQHEPPPWRP